MTTRVARLALAALVLAALLPGVARADRTFTGRWDSNDLGDIHIAANTLMTCPSHCAAEGGVSGPLNNNDNVMVRVDVDGDPTTFDSSSATLGLPAGASVLWAGLYWGADTTAGTGGTAAPDATQRDKVKLGVPGGSGYTTVTASTVDTTGGVRYQGFADVTSAVSAAGAGVYRVADVQAGTGNDRYAGWALVVAYHDDTAPPRNLSVFDGFVTVNSGSTPPPFAVSGFKTPPSGPVRTTLGAVTYEGDLGLTGDSLSLNGTPIADATNPSNNVFNSTISDHGALVSSGSDPNQVNHFGFDADLFTADGILPNGATSGTFALTTGGEAYYPGVLTFATELFAPKVRTTTTVTDLNGGAVEPGDILQYTVTGSNTGNDTADDVVLTTGIDTGLSYVPGTLDVTAGAFTGPQTDAAGDDRATYDAGTHSVIWHLGTGATPSAGGSLAPAAGFTTTFRVQVGAPADGAHVGDPGVTAYTGHDSGDGYTVTGSGGSVTVSGPDLAIDVVRDGALVRGDDTSYTLTVANGGSGPTHGAVTVTDDLPTGLELAGAPSGSGWDCSATTGTHVSCTRNDPLAPGASWPPITIPVHVRDDAPVTIDDGATVAGGGDGIHGNDTDHAAGGVASQADLSVTLTDSSAPIRPGATATITATVTNAGPSAAGNAAVAFTLPPGLHLVSASTGGTDCGGATCALGTLADGASTTAVLVVRADEDAAGALRVGASTSTSATDASPANDAASSGVDVFGPADLQVSVAHAAVIAGATATWTATVLNAGPSTASGVLVTLPVPDGLSDVAVGLDGVPGSCSVAGGVATCTVPALADGAAAVITFSGQVPSGAAGTTYTLWAQASAEQPDPHGADDVAMDTATATAVADLGVQAVAPAGVIAAGTDTAFTLEIHNNGPSDATGVVVTQTLPAGAVLVDPDPRCTQQGRVVTCVIGDFATGTAQALVLHVHAAQAFDGAALGLAAAVRGATTDADESNNALARTGKLICLSRRRFTIRLRLPHQGVLRKVAVRVDGKPVKVRHGKRLTAVVDLRGRVRAGRILVRISAQKRTGRWVVGTRAYKTCDVKLPAHKAPRI